MRWQLDTDVGVIEADALVGQLFEKQPGQTVTTTWLFKDDNELESAVDRHASLQPVVDAAQEQTIRTASSAGVPYYRERLAAFDNVNSLLIAIRPRDESDGVWAVVVDGADETPTIRRDPFIWSLDVFVLRQIKAGDTREQVESEFADEVI